MFTKALWITISIIAAFSLSVVAGVVHPSEKINALWLLSPRLFLCYCIRVLSSFLAQSAFPRRAARHPYKKLSTASATIDKPQVLFGHLFAAIATPGLIGPMLAAQFESSGFLDSGRAALEALSTTWSFCSSRSGMDAPSRNSTR
jgi:carbon starvation protein